MNKELLRSYITGFVLSFVLTISSFTLVSLQVYTHITLVPSDLLVPIVIGLALVQLVVQLIFFLHLLRGEKPRWNAIFFVGTLGIIFIVVVGSIWIMQHLNYNMTPQQMEKFTQSQDGF